MGVTENHHYSKYSLEMMYGILLNQLESYGILERYQSHGQERTGQDRGFYRLSSLVIDSSLSSIPYCFLSLLIMTDAILEYVTRYGFDSDSSVRINMQKTSNNGCKLKKLPYPATLRSARNSISLG